MSGIVNSTGAVSGLIGTTVGTPTGGGTLLQTVMAESTTATSTTGSLTAMVPTVNITPSSTDSKILVHWWGYVKLYGNNDGNNDKGWSFGLRRTVSASNTDKAFDNGVTYYQYYFALGSTFGSTMQLRMTSSFKYLDSPATTSEITYLPLAKAHQAQVTFSADSTTSIIIVQEVS